MTRLMKGAAAFVRAYLDDALVVAGFLLLAGGLAMYSAPLGLIVLGVGLIASVALGSR